MPALHIRRFVLTPLRHLLHAAMAWAMLLVLSATAHASLDLTASERKWLSAHPVIRIGVDPAYAPYAFFDERGRFAGVAAEFADRVSALLGVRFEIVQGLNWTQILDAARKREIDLITTAAHRPDREAFLTFSQIYIPTPLVIMTRQEMPRILTPRVLEGRRVALVQGYSSTDEVRDRLPALLPRLVANPLEGLRQVSSGEVDAYIGALGVNTYLANWNGLTNLKVNAGFDMSGGQRYGVRSDWPEFAALLDKALAAIPTEERNAIFARWVPVAIEDIPLATTALTPAERDFVTSFPRLRVGIGDDNEAFIRTEDKSQPDGIAVEFLREAARHTGLSLEWEVFDSDEAMHAALLRRRIDVIAAHVPTPHLGYRLLTTEPYFASPLVIMQRADHDELITWSQLPKYKVGLREAGFADRTLMLPPETHVVKLRTYAEALTSLANGDVDAVIGNLLTGSALIASQRLGNFRVSERIAGADAELRLAVHTDTPLLRSLLDKGLASISDADRAEIMHRWLSASLPRGLDPATVAAWFALAFVVAMTGFALFTRRNRELARAVAQSTSALSDSEERFRVIVEQAAIGIATISAEGHWLLVNDRLCDIVGYTREELLERTFQDITHPDDLSADAQAVADLLSGRIDTYVSEKRYIRKDGRPVWIDLTVAVVRQSPDNHPYFVVIVQDIDARKDVERQVRLLADSLEHRVTERTQQLAAANRELESFSYSVSHDLKAPLRGIDGYSALLDETLAGKLEGEAQAFLRNIRTGVRQMNTLIEDLLAYSRMERRTMHVAPIRLNELIGDVLGEFRHAIDERGIVMHLDLSEETACGDRSGLLLVLRNLIGNAVKFTAKSTTPEIRIETDTVGDKVRIRITDNGIGFDPRFRERIFEIFQRLNRAEDFEGTGIGLAISRKAVQRMSGDIQADSRPGAGATFTILLPKHPVNAPAETSD